MRIALLSLALLVACVDNADDESAEGAAFSSAAPPFTVAESQPTRYPILLHHGFNGSSTNSWSYYKVKEALEASGYDVRTTEVEPFNGVAVRAKTLASLVDETREAFCAKHRSDLGGKACEQTAKVNLIAHSMGGLDARYLASSLGYAPKIASITTISTPHYGTRIADVGLGIVRDEGKMSEVLDFLAASFGKRFTTSELAGHTNIRAALESLAESNAAAFNEANPDKEGVYYQSFAGVSRAIGGPRTESGRAEVLEACNGNYFGSIERADWMSPRLTLGSVVVGRFPNQPQDGMVTVANAKWSNFQGCFPADHLDEVGQIKKEGADSYTNFDHIVFYRYLANELAKKGY